MLDEILRLSSVILRMPLYDLLWRSRLFSRTISFEVIDRTIVDCTVDQAQRRLNQMQIGIAGPMVTTRGTRAYHEIGIFFLKIFLHPLEVWGLTNKLAGLVPFVAMVAGLERILVVAIT